MNRLGIFQLPDQRMTNMEGVRHVKSIGLGAFEPYAIHEFAEPDIAAAKEFAKLADGEGVTVPCFSMMADLYNDPDGREADRLKRYADLAAEAGIPYLHHTLFPTFQVPEAPVPFEHVMDVVLPKLTDIWDHAKRCGVDCIYEDQGYYFNGCENFRAFLKRFERPAGVVLDLGNVAFVNEKPLPFAKEFADRIRHVHIKDYRICRKTGSGECGNAIDGTCIDHALPGNGDMEIEAALDYVCKLKSFHGWFTLESAPIGDAYDDEIQNIEYLNGILQD